MNIGDKVTYIPFEECDRSLYEHGIVKAPSVDNYLFVVFNCGGNWDEYSNYTAQRTCIDDLREGWI